MCSPFVFWMLMATSGVIASAHTVRGRQDLVQPRAADLLA